MSCGESSRPPLCRNPGWRDPAVTAADAGWTGLPRCLGEWVVMGWAAVVVLAFGLEVGLVIWLARRNTARWERDHRAARAAIQARKEASLRVRAAGLVAQRVPPGIRRLPHPHLSQLPHVHLPPRVADRIAHTREALHHPRLHLPHLPRQRSRPRPQPETPDGADETTTGTVS